MKASFRLNIYDKDGDVNETGIFIYFGNTIIKFTDLYDLKDTINHLNNCVHEISETEGMAGRE